MYSGCNPNQILRAPYVCHLCATESREASSLWLPSSKAQHLTVTSFAFQGSWWPGPCFSCLFSWLSCSELSWTSGLAARVLSLAMASSHPSAVSELPPTQPWCKQTPGWARFGGRKELSLYTLRAVVCLFVSWWGPCRPGLG